MATWAPIRYAHNGDVAIAYSETGAGDVDLVVLGGFVSHLEIMPSLPMMGCFFERLGDGEA